MKKIKFLMITLSFVTALLLLSSFKVSTITELKNEEYNQQLFLYTDGTCVIRTENGRGTGTYDLRGGTCYFEWDNGIKNQGYYVIENNQVKSVSVEGVTYSRRIVVQRR